MNNKIKKTLKFLMIITIIMWVWNGLVSGFVWEHLIVEHVAKKYVEEKYKFTVTEVKSSIILDYSVMVGIRTKELQFPFTVNLSRTAPFSSADKWDNYLDELASYLLKRDFKEFVKTVTSDRAFGYLSFRKTPVKDLKLSEVEINSEKLYEKTQNEYQCVIVFDGLKKGEQLNIDYDLYYKIFQYVMSSKLKPYEIWFRWYDKDVQEKGSAIIHSIGFGSDKYDQIKSGEDLKKFIKIEPKK